MDSQFDYLECITDYAGVSTLGQTCEISIWAHISTIGYLRV